MSRNERPSLVAWAVCLAMVSSLVLGAYPVRAEETLEERRARIESMDPAQKAGLRRAQERLAALDSAEQERLRRLHDKIENHPRSDDLRSVMTQYCEWIKTLTPYQRDELRELPPAERIERIKQLRKEQTQTRRAGRGGMRGSFWGDRLRKLAIQEGDGLIRWIDKYMSRDAPELIDDLSEPQQKELREELEKAKHLPEQRRKLFARLWIRWELANPGKLLPLDDRALEELRSELSPPTRQWLEQMPLDRQRRFLAASIGVFLFRHNHEELSEYLQKEISGEQRDRLTSLPPEQMRQQLWWLYIRSKWPDMSPRFPRRGPGGLRHHGPPYGGSPGGPRGPSRGPQSARPPLGPSPPPRNRPRDPHLNDE